MFFYTLSAPAQRKFSFGIFIFLHFAALICGFVLCQQYFTELEISLSVIFDAARSARREALDAIKAIHAIVLSTKMGDNALFDASISSLRHLNDLIVSTLTPFVSQQPAYQLDSYRVYFPQLFMNDTSRIDFTPKDTNSLELIYALGRATAITLSYSSFGTLTPEKFLSSPELRYLSENLLTFLDCIRLLPYKAISNFFNSLSSSFLLLTSFLCLNLLVLASFALFSYVNVSVPCNFVPIE
jgi:hypothetical protein